MSRAHFDVVRLRDGGLLPMAERLMLFWYHTRSMTSHQIPITTSELVDTPYRRVVSLARDGVPEIPVLGVNKSIRTTEGSIFHRHAYLEITYCALGNVKFDCGGRAYPIIPGSVFLSRPNDVHRLRINPKGAKVYWIFLKLPQQGERFMGLSRAETKWIVKSFKALPHKTFAAPENVGRCYERLFAVYDADGNRQNLGITDAASMSVLAPGTATYDHDSWPAIKWSKWGNSPAELFDGSSYHKPYENNYEFNVINFGERAIMLGDETRWMSLVCRLTNATPEIASYDIGYKFGYKQADWASSTVLTAYAIQGSVDGLVWDELAADDEVDAPDDAHQWLSDKAAYWNNAVRKVTGNGDCFPLRGKPNARYKVTAKDGKLTLEPSGLLLIVK
mgnify:CR=1 FL=1